MCQYVRAPKRRTQDAKECACRRRAFSNVRANDILRAAAQDVACRATAPAGATFRAFRRDAALRQNAMSRRVLCVGPVKHVRETTTTGPCAATRPTLVRRSPAEELDLIPGFTHSPNRRLSFRHPPASKLRRLGTSLREPRPAPAPPHRTDWSRRPASYRFLHKWEIFCLSYARVPSLTLRRGARVPSNQKSPAGWHLNTRTPWAMTSPHVLPSWRGAAN